MSPEAGTVSCLVSWRRDDKYFHHYGIVDKALLNGLLYYYITSVSKRRRKTLLYSYFWGETEVGRHWLQWVKVRLFLAEQQGPGLSSGVIEALGSALQLDPRSVSNEATNPEFFQMCCRRCRVVGGRVGSSMQACSEASDGPEQASFSSTHTPK